MASWLHEDMTQVHLWEAVTRLSWTSGGGRLLFQLLESSPTWAVFRTKGGSLGVKASDLASPFTLRLGEAAGLVTFAVTKLAE